MLTLSRLWRRSELRKVQCSTSMARGFRGTSPRSGTSCFCICLPNIPRVSSLLDLLLDAALLVLEDQSHHVQLAEAGDQELSTYLVQATDGTEEAY